MLTKNVTDDEDFVALSSSAQALYLHLSMSADDDGFTKQISTSMFKSHASVQDLEALLAKRFVFQFESGVIVIRHWRMANALRQDRRKATNFKEELAMLNLDDTGTYDLATKCQPSGNQVSTKCQPSGNQVSTKCQPSGNQAATQYRLGKDRLVEDSLGKDSKEETPLKGGKEENRKRFSAPTVDDVKDYAFEKGLNIDAARFVDYYESNGWMVGRNRMKDWKAACRNWAAKDKAEQKAKPKGNSWDAWKDV